MEVLPLLSTAKETGEGGGAGGRLSTKLGCIFAGLGREAVIMAREISCVKVARTSWEMGGATETEALAVEMEAIVDGVWIEEGWR